MKFKPPKFDDQFTLEFTKYIYPPSKSPGRPPDRSDQRGPGRFYEARGRGLGGEGFGVIYEYP